MTAEGKRGDVRSAEAERNPPVPAHVPGSHDQTNRHKTDRITALQDGVGE